VLDMFTDARTGGFGFRTVCGFAIMLSILSAVSQMLNI